MIRSLWLCLVLLSFWPPAAARAAETRVALVIGNGAYAASPLTNPGNDARAMAAVLRQLGFDVTLLRDLGRRALRAAIRDFGRRLVAGSTGLFYYSGHGMQVQGRNYMIPVDADIQDEPDVAADGVELANVLQYMHYGASNPNFVILDACRDNPFEKSYKSARQGLAGVDAPRGTLIAYAAAPGQTAWQGPHGGLSPFTSALIKRLPTPNLSPLSLFNRVSLDVLEAERGSGGRRPQEPWVSASALPETFFFADRRAGPVPITPAAGAGVDAPSDPVTPGPGARCREIDESFSSRVKVTDGSCFQDKGGSFRSEIRRVGSGAVVYYNFRGEEVTCFKGDTCSFGWPGSPVFSVSFSGSEPRSAYIVNVNP